ncbi:MAG: hypothetical protein NTY35_15230 [Planctomycetota bacterium]|nr:hypothetical protein [Planctomycetota bacterium]
MIALSIAGLLAVQVAVQRPHAPQREQTVHAAADPAFAEAESSYKSALQVYDQARLEAGRGRGPAPTTHPASTFWPRMESVAQGGSTRAREWLCENIAEGVPDPTRRLAIIERELDALLACCASETALLAPITALWTQANVIGMDKALFHLDRIADGAKNPEVQSRALFQQAFLISDRGRTTDPAQLARAAELQLSVVLAFPATRAAREAADILETTAQRDLVAAMRTWVDRAAEMQAAGRPATDWPQIPFHAFRARFEPLAATQFPAAKDWMENLYPSFVQAEKLGPALLLSSLARDLALHYPVRDLDWGPLRMRLLGLAVRVGGGESPWIPSTLTTVTAQAPELPALAALPFTQAVLDLCQSSESRAQALWIEAQTRILDGSEAEFGRALSALDAIVAKHKDMIGLVEKANVQASGLRLVLPGATLPDSRAAEWGILDLEGLDLVLSGYRGRVLMIDVFDVYAPEFAGRVAERAGLRASLAGRPFDLVGLCMSRATVAAVGSALKQAGVDWRCGLLQGENHPYVTTLYANRKQVTTILVDAQGVIRARNRPFAELARLAAELTAEAERSSPGK